MTTATTALPTTPEAARKRPSSGRLPRPAQEPARPHRRHHRRRLRPRRAPRATDRPVRPRAAQLRERTRRTQLGPLARHRRPRTRPALPHRVRGTRLHAGRPRRRRAGLRHRRAPRPGRRLLRPVRGQHHLPAHRHHAGVPVPGARRRPGRDPRPVADQRHHRHRHLADPRSHPHHPGRDPAAQARRLRRRGHRQRRWRRHRALPAHPPQRHLGTDRAGDRRHPRRDHRRGAAQLPRARCPAAGPVAQCDALRRPVVPGARPWLAVFPGLAIVAATLAFNLLGDGLRDVLDPRGGTR